MRMSLLNRPRGASCAGRLLSAALLMSLAGCGQEKPAPEPAAPPTPQERFDAVVTYMRNQLDDQGLRSSAGRATIRDKVGVGNTAWSFRIAATPKISPPRKGETRRQASIKVTYETTYSSTRLPPPREGVREQKEKSSPDGLPEDPDQFLSEDDSAPDFLDSNLVEEISETSSRPLTDRPQMASRTTKTRTVTVYHLEYRNHRWVLAVPPPHDATPTVNAVLRIALKRQG